MSAAAVAPASPAAVAAVEVMIADPNFTGVWRSSGHDNMEAFLIARGFPERNAALASAAVVVQRIRHTRTQLVVEVGDVVTSYVISNGRARSAEADSAESESASSAGQNSAEDDLAAALLQNNAEWVEAGTAAAAAAPAAAQPQRRLASSTGDIDTLRELSADGSTMTVSSTAHTEQGDVVATTTFQKLQPEDHGSAADGVDTSA